MNNPKVLQENESTNACRRTYDTVSPGDKFLLKSGPLAGLSFELILYNISQEGTAALFFRSLDEKSGLIIKVNRSHWLTYWRDATYIAEDIKVSAP